MPRTALELCEKTAFEKLLFDFDFSPVLLAGETVTNTPAIVVTAEPTTAPPLSGMASPVLASPKVQVVLDAGLAGTTYTMRCKVTTSAGYERECVGTLIVRDD